MRSMFCLMLALAATLGSAAEVYRSVSPEGVVIYSDRPTGSDSRPVVVAASRAAAPSTPQSAQATQPEQAAPASSEGSATEATAAELAEERRRNCDVARERAARYQTAHRIYRTLPNGEREYLDDAEIDEARANAAAQVENWCS